MQWRALLAPVTIVIGYAAAIYLVGGISPDHKKLYEASLKAQLIAIAENLISPA